MVVIQKFIRVNERIRTPQIRLIGPDGEQLGVLSNRDALDLARKHELDLVEIAPQAKPPVCRIMDFSKYKYDQEKKERANKKHQKLMHLKEVRMKPHIEEHDYHVKLKRAIEFLQKKDKVKISLFFRGREMAHRDLGRKVLDRFVSDTAEHGQVDSPPKFEGRRMTVTVMPK